MGIQHWGVTKAVGLRLQTYRKHKAYYTALRGRATVGALLFPHFAVSVFNVSKKTLKYTSTRKEPLIFQNKVRLTPPSRPIHCPSMIHAGWLLPHHWPKVGSYPSSQKTAHS